MSTDKDKAAWSPSYASAHAAAIAAANRCRILATGLGELLELQTIAPTEDMLGSLVVVLGALSDTIYGSLGALLKKAELERVQAQLDDFIRQRREREGG